METSWETRERDQTLTIVHDNRWLAVIGVPLSIVGLVIAIGPWLIDDARNSGAWPILCVGSLIGTGIVVAGCSLCFKYEEFVADRRRKTLTRHAGLSPFRRSKEWSLSEFDELACVDEQMSRSSGPGSSLHHRLRLIGTNTSVLVASDLETDPVLAEAKRWSTFLELPLCNRMGLSRESQLREDLSKNRSPKH